MPQSTACRSPRSSGGRPTLPHRFTDTSRGRPTALPERLSRHLVLYGVVLVLLQLAFRAWALAGSWFYFDDIAFMSRAMNEPLDASYLLESYGGHLMPGGFLAAWLLTKVAVYSWAPWAAVLLALQALAGFGMLRLLVSLFGRRPLVLALLAGYLAYVFTLSAGIWFAAGINQLPMQVALVFGLHAHVEYLRHRRIRSLVAALLWTVGRAAVLREDAAAARHLRDRRLRLVLHRRHAATGSRHLWSHYRAGVLAYGVAGRRLPRAVRRSYGLDFSPGNANTQPWSPIAYEPGRHQRCSPALIGGPLRWQPLAVGSFADPTQVVVLAVVGRVRRRSWCTPTAPAPRAAGRGACSASPLVCNVVLLASARANVVGPGHRPRVPLPDRVRGPVRDRPRAWRSSRCVGAPEQNAVRDRRPATSGATRGWSRRSRPRSWSPALVSSVRYVDLWQDGNPSEAYFANVERTPRQAADDKPVPLVDIGIPQTLLWAYRYPENTYSHVFRNLDRPDRPTRARRSTSCTCSTTRASLAAGRHPADPLDQPGVAAAATRSTATTPPRSRSTARSSAAAGGCGSPTRAPSAVDAARRRPATRCTTSSCPKGLHNVFVQAAGEFERGRAQRLPCRHRALRDRPHARAARTHAAPTSRRR